MSIYTKVILDTVGQILKNRGQKETETVEHTKGEADPVLEKIKDIFETRDEPLEDDHDEVRDVDEEYDGRDIDDWDEDDDEDQQEKEAAKRAWKALKDAHKREWEDMKRRHEDERDALKQDQDSDRRHLRGRFEDAYGGRQERRKERRQERGMEHSEKRKDKGRGGPWSDENHPGKGKGRGRGKGKGPKR